MRLGSESPGLPVTFLIAMRKYLIKAIGEGGGVEGSQSITVEKVRQWEHEGAWSHYFWGREGENDECWYSAHFPLFTEYGN